MNKKDLTEADIRTKFITPALAGQNADKWNVMTQLREEVYITRGRVIVRGQMVKRGEAKKLDYLLFYKPGIPLAVLEANGAWSPEPSVFVPGMTRKEARALGREFGQLAVLAGHRGYQARILPSGLAPARNS